MAAAPPPRPLPRVVTGVVAPALLALVATLLLAPWLPVWLGRDLAGEARLLAALLPGLLILLPPALASARPLPTILTAAGLTGALALPAQGPVPVAAAPAVALTAAAAVALLVALVGIAAAQARPAARGAWHGLLLVGLVLAALAPVWLAVVLDPLADWPGFVDGLVALNPLTLLGTAWGQDFPRADWFYRHSPLGSLRYALPPSWILFGTGALLIGVGAWRLGRQKMNEEISGPTPARLPHHDED